MKNLKEVLDNILDPTLDVDYANVIELDKMTFEELNIYWRNLARESIKNKVYIITAIQRRTP